jgi:superfamily II DNA/RNA helicase
MTFTPEYRERTYRWQCFLLHEGQKSKVLISLKDEDQTLKWIKQYYVNLGNKKGASFDMLKFEVLTDIYSIAKISQSVIFCNRIDRAISLYDNLTEKGFGCGLFRSDLSQEERNRFMKDFKTGKFRILVSSGLMSRGLDIQTLSVVVNFDIPSEREIDNLYT